MNTNNKKIQHGQTERLEGVISGLLRKLEQLAPHPDRVLHLAPIFTATSHGKIITGIFNRKTLYERAADAYAGDLPARLRIESRIACCTRKLAALRCSIFSVPELAAA